MTKLTASPTYLFVKVWVIGFVAFGGCKATLNCTGHLISCLSLLRSWRLLLAFEGLPQDLLYYYQVSVSTALLCHLPSNDPARPQYCTCAIAGLVRPILKD